MKIASRSQEKGSTRHNGGKYSNTILTPFIQKSDAFTVEEKMITCTVCKALL